MTLSGANMWMGTSHVLRESYDSYIGIIRNAKTFLYIDPWPNFVSLVFGLFVYLFVCLLVGLFWTCQFSAGRTAKRYQNWIGIWLMTAFYFCIKERVPSTPVVDNNSLANWFLDVMNEQFMTALLRWVLHVSGCPPRCWCRFACFMSLVEIVL